MQLKPVTITDFKGLVEATDELNVDPGAARAMSNVMLTDANSMKSRAGFTSLGPGAEQGYITRDGARAFIVSGGTLSELLPGGGTLVLAAVPAGRIYWEEVGDQIILSGPVYGVIQGESFVEFPSKPPQPAVERIPGDLPAGEYIIAMLDDSKGIDSQSCFPVHEFLDGTEALAITTPDVAGSYRVYVSFANGDVPYLAGVGGPSQRIEVSAQPATGLALSPGMMEGADFPEGCERLALFDSRIWRAQFDQSQDTTFIYPSGVFRFATAVLTDYIAVPGEVTAMAGVPTGLFIATRTRLYFTNGAEMTKLANYGAPPHHHIALDDNDVAWIWSNQGLVKAAPFENVTYDTVRDVPAHAVSTHRLQDPDGDQLVVIFEQLA